MYRTCLDDSLHYVSDSSSCHEKISNCWYSEFDYNCSSLMAWICNNLSAFMIITVAAQEVSSCRGMVWGTKISNRASRDCSRACKLGPVFSKPGFRFQEINGNSVVLCHIYILHQLAIYMLSTFSPQNGLIQLFTNLISLQNSFNCV